MRLLSYLLASLAVLVTSSPALALHKQTPPANPAIPGKTITKHLASHQQMPPVNPAIPGKIITKNLDLSPFHAVSLYGPLNVQICANNPRYSIQMQADQATLNTIQVSIQNGILYVTRVTKLPKNTPKNSPLRTIARRPILMRISLPCLTALNEYGGGYTTATCLSGPLAVDIRGNISARLTGTCIDLNNLTVIGSAQLTICGIYSHCLAIQHSGSGNVHLDGEANLRSLQQDGSGNTSLLWVNSNQVKIHSEGSGRIALAGSTCQLTAFLDDYTHLNAINLHAKRGYIHTAGRSFAEVWVNNTLLAWAQNCSSIYYYKDPVFISRQMEPPALILRTTRICC